MINFMYLASYKSKIKVFSTFTVLTLSIVRVFLLFAI